MVREEGSKMSADADRADPGTSAPMRDGECLVQIEVGDVGAKATRLRQTDERVEVGPVDIDLPAGVVDDLDRAVMPSSKTPWVEG